jgi:hypothetical protein
MATTLRRTLLVCLAMVNAAGYSFAPALALPVA